MPPEDNPLEFLTGLQASVLFRALPEILDAHAWMFIAAAFLLLAGSFAWRMYEAGNGGRATMNVWYRMLLVLTFMLLSPKLCLWGYEAVDSVVADGGGRTPNSVTRKCIKLALSTPELESVLSKYSRSVQYPTLPSSGDVRRAVEEEGLWGYAKAFWYTLGEEVSGIRSEGSDKTGVLTEGPVLVASMAAGLLKALALMASSAVGFFFLVMAGMTAHLMGVLRYVLLMVGATAMPAFVAGFNTSIFRRVAQRYVVGIFSVLLWPIWWMLGHIGTVGLFNAYVKLLSGTSVVTSPLNEDFVSRFCWENIDATMGHGPLSAVVGGGLLATGASAPYLYLGLTALGAFGLFVWVLLVTIGGPWLGHRLLVAGLGEVVVKPASDGQGCVKELATIQRDIAKEGRTGDVGAHVDVSIASRGPESAPMPGRTVSRVPSIETRVASGPLRTGERHEERKGYAPDTRVIAGALQIAGTSVPASGAQIADRWRQRVG